MPAVRLCPTRHTSSTSLNLGRCVLPPGGPLCFATPYHDQHPVMLQAPASGSNRSIHVYSNAPLVRKGSTRHCRKPSAYSVVLSTLQVSLQLNGAPAGGSPQPMPAYGQAAFSVPFAAGNLTAVAWDATGTTVLASHSTRERAGLV